MGERTGTVEAASASANTLASRIGALAILIAALSTPSAALANPNDGPYAGQAQQDPVARVRFDVSGGKLRDLNVSHLQFTCRRRADVRRNPPALDGAIAVQDGAFRGRLVRKSAERTFAANIGGRLLQRGGAQGWLTYSITYPNRDRCTAVPAPVEWTATNRDLRFTSGFENPVTVGPPVAENGTWRFPIQGSDRDYDWTADLPGRGGHAFVPIVPETEQVTDYANTTIQDVTGPYGTPTHALFQAVFKDAEFYPHRRVRNQFALFRAGRRGSVSYWIKLQGNLRHLMPRGDPSWRFLEEFRAGRRASDYRMSVGLLRRKTGPIQWEIAGRRLLPSYKQDWTLLRTKPPVPLGEWFRLTTSWLISRHHGYLRVSVNGEKILDHEGRTRREVPIDSMQIFKVYTGANSLARGPAYQWIDDVEMRRGLLSPPALRPPAPARR